MFSGTVRYCASASRTLVELAGTLKIERPNKQRRAQGQVVPKAFLNGGRRMKGEKVNQLTNQDSARQKESRSSSWFELDQILLPRRHPVTWEGK